MTPSSVASNSPKLGAIRPLRVRELLFWQGLWPALGLRLANHVTADASALEFIPGVTLSMTRSDPGHLAILYCGFLELTLSRRIASSAARGGLLVDVGANHGYFTSLWAAAAPQNQVIAFEPAPIAHAALLANLALSDLDGQVTAHRAAAGKNAAVAGFIESPGGQSGMSRLTRDDDEVSPSTTVDVVALDDVLYDTQPNPAVDVLKIDAEGADAWVLAGAGRLLQEKRVREVFFEQDKRHQDRLGVSGQAPQAILSRFGYKSRRIGRFVWRAIPDR
jgi:FkbM family methyltransferase